MSLLSDFLRGLPYGLFTLLVYRSQLYNHEPTSHLPQGGIILAAYGLFGAAVLIPAFAFLSFATGYFIYAIRKRKVDAQTARLQAVLVGLVSFVALVVASCAAVTYLFRDLYLP